MVLLVGVFDIDEVMGERRALGGAGFGGSDVEVTVHLHGIRAYHLRTARKPPEQDVGLTYGGGSEEAQDAWRGHAYSSIWY